MNMYKKIFVSLVLSLAFILSSCAPVGQLDPGKRVIGYYAQWAAGRNFFVKHISASKLTHINYAFANVSPEGQCILGDPVADVERVHTADESVSGQADSAEAAMHGNFNQLLQLKEKYPHLQVLISVGGY